MLSLENLSLADTQSKVTACHGSKHHLGLQERTISSDVSEG